MAAQSQPCADAGTHIPRSPDDQEPAAAFTASDVGRSVVYRGHAGEREEGVITSVGERYVFVRYRSQHPSAPGQATDPDQLEWG